MKTFAIAGAAIGLAISAAPALAGGTDVRTDSFTIADINLETAEGQKVLDQRIKRAAKNVCRVADIRTGSRLKSPEVQACFAKAKANAKSQVAAIQYDQRRGG